MSQAYDPVETDLAHNAPASDTRTDEDFEAEARANNWVPLEDFRGPPEAWRPAKEFVLRGESIASIATSRNRELRKKQERQDNEIAELRRTVAEQSEAIKAAVSLAKTASDRGYARAMAELETKRMEAVEAGDTAVFKQTQQEIDAMITERDKTPAPVVPAAPAPANPQMPGGMHPDVYEFTERPENKWFKDDAQLRQAMMAMHQVVVADDPSLTMVEQLAAARAELVKRYPAKFPASQRRAAPAVEPDDDDEPAPQLPNQGRAPVRNSAPVTVPQSRARDPFMRITDAGEREEQRQACKRIQAGDPGYDEKTHVDIYLDPHGDVLQIMARNRKA